jgi:hypothetical protein
MPQKQILLLPKGKSVRLNVFLAEILRQVNALPLHGKT